MHTTRNSSQENIKKVLSHNICAPFGHSFEMRKKNIFFNIKMQHTPKLIFLLLKFFRTCSKCTIYQTHQFDLDVPVPWFVSLSNSFFFIKNRRKVETEEYKRDIVWPVIPLSSLDLTRNVTNTMHTRRIRKRYPRCNMEIDELLI